MTSIGWVLVRRANDLECSHVECARDGLVAEGCQQCGVL